MSAEPERMNSQAHVPAAFRKLTGGMEKGTFRHKLAHYIESPWVEILVLILVLADVVLVSIEAGIDHHVFCVNGYRLRGIPQSDVLEPYHGVAEETLLQVGPPFWNDPLQSAGPLLRGRSRAHHIGPGPLLLDIADHPHDKGHDDGHGHSDGGGHAEHHGDGEHGHGGHGHGGHSLGPPGALICEDRYGFEAAGIVHQCHIWSIIILCIFVVELSLKLVANPTEFCGNPFHVLDFIIVVLSLIVDTFVMWYIAEHAESMRGKTDEVETILVLLIICRIWRVVRIVHGLFEVAHGQHEHQEELKHHMEELEEKNKDLERQLSTKPGKK